MLREAKLNWSKLTQEDGTGSATISDTGLLTAVTDGMVSVKATAIDGSDIYGEFTITIDVLTNIVDFNDAKISVYPNPVEDVLNISNASGTSISIYSITRVCLHKDYLTNDNYSIDLSKFDNGIFILKLTKSGLQKSIKFSCVK